MTWVGALLLGLGLLATTSPQAQRPRGLSDAERDFLTRHWQRPIQPQGEAPGRFTPLERSLAPASCGSCHPVQYADWQSSLHAKSMGPGITGQLEALQRSDPAAARSCPACHAPLAEQSPELRSGPEISPNPAFDASLRQQGVVCAACHVRGHRRFGPPPRPGSPVTTPGDIPPHDGATHSQAYLRSEFCSSCHQFDRMGPRLNGKPLENTYEEWRSSPAARQGLQCQDCHMPDRRHRWRGIHDPEMVKSGLRIALQTERARYRPGDRLQARLTIVSVRVGHYFPTYVTPRVLVRAALLDESGRVLPGSVEERTIGRQVPLDLSREIADTRIPPGRRFTLRYAPRLDQSGLRLRVTVTVYPDYFYTRFFEALLAGGAGRPEEIREALEATRRSSFEIFARELSLT